MIDRTIQTYINEERDRCAGLVEKLADDPDFLLYCINSSIYSTDDLAAHRQRFAELSPEVEQDDPLADLM